MKVTGFSAGDADLAELLRGQGENGVGENAGLAAAEGDEASVD